MPSTRGRCPRLHRHSTYLRTRQESSYDRLILPPRSARRCGCAVGPLTPRSRDSPAWSSFASPSWRRPGRSSLHGGLLTGALNGVPHVGGVLRAPGAKQLEVEVLLESLEQPLPATQHERRGGDRELVDHARRKALADQVGATTEGDPAVAGELARLHQRGVEALNEQEARTRIGLVLGAVGQHNQRSGERVGAAPGAGGVVHVAADDPAARPLGERLVVLPVRAVHTAGVAAVVGYVVAVMDPFHVVRLAGDALNDCRRRVQQTTRGRRGRKNDPLYRARRTVHTGADLLTDKQAARLTALFAIDEHVEVEATWGIYQRMIAAYRHPDPAAGRELMVKLIESLSAGVPRPLVEIAKLGRTLSKRAADVLAYFDRPGTSNGPTEAINGRLEHLRGSALGFRNLTNYIARSLLEIGGFRPRLHPALVKSRSSWGSAKDTTETGNQ